MRTSSGDDVATASTGESFFLESKALESQMASAKQGNNLAALRVANHFGLGEGMPSKAYPWFLMAAERGDIGAMRSVGVYLSSDGGLDNCREALEWLKRAGREASPQENEQYGIAETYKSLEVGFDECVKRKK